MSSAAERTRRWRERMTAERRELERQKDAARKRVRRGRARQNDFRLLGWVPPRDWPDPFRAESVTDPTPHVRREQTPCRAPAAKEYPGSGVLPRLDGLLRRLCGRLRPRGSRRPNGSARRSVEILANDTRPGALLRRKPRDACEELLVAHGVFDLSPHRRREWAGVLARKFGQVAAAGLLLVIGDVALAGVRSVGAVVAHRLKYLAAGDLERALSRNGPKSLERMQELALARISTGRNDVPT